MTWVTTSNPVPRDIARVWNPDGANGFQTMADGPVDGTAAFSGVNGTVYGPSYWQESSVHGIAAEAAAHYGDWTWEGFVRLNSTTNSLLYSAGGWYGQVVEAGNITCTVYINSSNKIACYWETGVNVAVTPSAASTTALALNTWYHVAVVKDSVAKTLTFYLNGVADGSATFASNPTGGNSSTPGECRTGYAPYVNYIFTSNVRISCGTFSTVKRSGAWISANAARRLTDGTLSTDGSTWNQIGPVLRSDIETRGVMPAEAARADGYGEGYEDGYEEGYDDGVGASPPPDGTPPTIEVISPTPGVAPGQPGGFPLNKREAQATPIVLRITDLAPGLAYLCVTVRFTDGSEEVVYRRGQFRGPHIAGSTQSLSLDGTELTLSAKRRGGWPDVRYLVFAVDAIDGVGNVAA